MAAAAQMAAIEIHIFLCLVLTLIFRFASFSYSLKDFFASANEVCVSSFNALDFSSCSLTI